MRRRHAVSVTRAVACRRLPPALRPPAVRQCVNALTGYTATSCRLHAYPPRASMHIIRSIHAAEENRRADTPIAKAPARLTATTKGAVPLRRHVSPLYMVKASRGGGGELGKGY